MNPELILTEEAKAKIKETVTLISRAHPDVPMFHGVFFFFGIDEDGRMLPKMEIFNTFGRDFAGMHRAIQVMSEIISQHEEAEVPHDPHQTH